MKLLKILLPIVVLVIALGVAVVIISSKPEPERSLPETVAPAVEYLTLESEPVRLLIDSQGTVQPRTQTTLVAEVSGRVVEVAENFRPGGFFNKGEVLLVIDDADLQAALALEEANMAQAEFNVEQEIALAEQAAIDWEDLGEGEPTALALRKPQIKQAEAALKSAEARVLRAKRDLDRSIVNAPFDCLILRQEVDLGGFVSGNPGTQIATIYSTDFAEVRLPLSSDEIGLVELPFAYLGEEPKQGPSVKLLAQQGGELFEWQGHISRTEASIDERSRLAYVVAKVDEPFSRDAAYPSRPPLKPGLYVEAIIEGKELDDAFVIPRFALRENNTVLIAAPDDTLLRKVVTVVQSNDTIAIITSGLSSGDRLITSPLEYAVDGMDISPEALEDETNQ